MNNWEWVAVAVGVVLAIRERSWLAGGLVIGAVVFAKRTTGGGAVPAVSGTNDPVPGPNVGASSTTSTLPPAQLTVTAPRTVQPAPWYTPKYVPSTPPPSLPKVPVRPAPWYKPKNY